MGCHVGVEAAVGLGIAVAAGAVATAVDGSTVASVPGLTSPYVPQLTVAPSVTIAPISQPFTAKILVHAVGLRGRLPRRAGTGRSRGRVNTPADVARAGTRSYRVRPTSRPRCPRRRPAAPAPRASAAAVAATSSPPASGEATAIATVRTASMMASPAR